MKIKILPLFLAILIMLCATSCKASPQTEAEASVEPSENEPLEDGEYPVDINGANLESRPGVIVSLSPAITEKLADLGLQNRLEGISDYCDEPEGLPRARVGTVQLLDLEELARLSPHLVLTETEFTEAETSAIAAMGAKIAIIPRADSIDGVIKNYKAIAMLLEGKRTGEALSGAFEKKFMQKYEAIIQNKLPEPKNAVYLRVLDFTVATGDTLEGKLMEQIGLNNIAGGQTEWLYPEEEANSEEGRANFTSIDFIFCDKRSVTIKMLEKSTFYKGLNAVLKDHYLYIDSTVFERQTIRMLDELDRMRLYALGEIPGSKDELETAGETSAA